MNGAEIIGLLALLIAGYGALLSTRNFLWQQRREQQRRESDIGIGLVEGMSLGGGALVIGETRHLEHKLTIRVINRGEAPEYVHAIDLENEHAPFVVSVRKPEGTVEVRPRDQADFPLVLDGSQGFVWDEPLRAVVRLADGQEFVSPYVPLGREPGHGRQVVIRDPDLVPDDQVVRLGPEDIGRKTRS